MPCDAFLDSGKTDPSGEVLSCSACMGQIEDTLFWIVIFFGITDEWLTLETEVAVIPVVGDRYNAE